MIFKKVKMYGDFGEFGLSMKIKHKCGQNPSLFLDKSVSIIFS